MPKVSREHRKLNQEPLSRRDRRLAETEVIRFYGSMLEVVCVNASGELVKAGAAPTRSLSIHQYARLRAEQRKKDLADVRKHVRLGPMPHGSADKGMSRLDLGLSAVGVFSGKKRSGDYRDLRGTSSATASIEPRHYGGEFGVVNKGEKEGADMAELTAEMERLQLGS